MKNFIILLVTALLFVGCYTKKRALEKFCKPTPVQVQFDTIIKLVAIAPGDSGEVALPCQEFKALYDSLLKAGSRKIDSNGYKIIFENKKTALKAKPNANGSINLNVVDKGDSVIKEIPVTMVKEIPCNCPPTDINIWELLKYYLIGAITALAVIAVLLTLKKQ